MAGSAAAPSGEKKAAGTAARSSTYDLRTADRDDLQPVTSLQEARVILGRPFTSDAIKIKLQTNPKGANGSGQAVVYIDARLVAARLNAVPGLRWSHRLLQIPFAVPQDAIASALCRLHVEVGQGDDMVTEDHEDVGTTGNKLSTDMGMKALASDALKRSAVHLGIGQSVYAFPAVWIQASDLGSYESNSGTKYKLNAANERLVRERYAAWLNNHGVKLFGKPLDHGDVEGAQGDVEANGATDAPPENDEVPTYGPTLAPQSQASVRKALAVLLGVDGQGTEAADALLDSILADAFPDDGTAGQRYLPRIVGRALMLTAQARNKLHPTNDPKGDGDGPTPAT